METQIENIATKFSFKENVTVIAGFYKKYAGTIKGYKQSPEDKEKIIYLVNITTINKDIWLEEQAIQKYKKFGLF